MAAAVVLIIGISLSYADESDATGEDSNVITDVENGLTYELNLETLNPLDPVVTIVAWDESVVDVVIPASKVMTVTDEEGVNNYTCRIVVGTKAFDEKLYLGGDYKPETVGIFAQSKVLKSVVVKDGTSGSVTLPTAAFIECPSLTNVTIGSSVKEVPERCFYNDVAISNLILNNGIQKIGIYSFNAYYKMKPVLTSVVIPGSVEIIGSHAFDGMGSLTDLTLSNGIINIENVAFAACSGLTTLTLPDSVTTLGSRAFYGCSGLTVLTLSSGITTAGEEVFNNCGSLKTLSIPAKLEVSIDTLGNLIPSGCTKIIVDPENPCFESTETGDVLMSKTGVKTLMMVLKSAIAGSSFDVPDGIQVIGSNCFKTVNSYSFRELNLPASVTKLEDYAFADAKGLRTINGTDNITEIGSYILKNCYSLKNINLPKVTVIPALAFAGSKLSSYDFTNVTDIGVRAFENCNLKTIELSDSVKSIGDRAFYGSKLTTAVIGEYKQTVSVGPKAFWNCNSLTDIEFKNVKFDFDSEYYGQVVNGAALKTVKYPDGFNLWKNEGPLCISNDGKVIYSCYRSYDGVITIPSTVTEIPEYKGGSLSDGVFADSKIKGVIFENDRSEVITVAQNLFYNCKNLETVVFCDDIRYYDIGNGKYVDGIEYRTFSGMDGFVSKLKYVSFGNHGIYEMPIVTNLYFDGVNGNSVDPNYLVGSVFLSNGDGKLSKVGYTTTAVSKPSIDEVTIPGNLELVDDIIVKGDIVIPNGVSVTGTFIAIYNSIQFDGFTSVGAETLISYNHGIINVDGPAENTGVLFETSRVSDIGINGFTDCGESVVVDINAYTEAIPDGLMLVQYSVYTEVDGEQFLNPFKVAAVDVEGDSTVIADVGERMLSCAVSYCYDFNGREYWTPVSETAVMMPAEFVQMVAPLGVSMTIGNDIIENGEFLAFGTYSVKFTVPEGTQYQLNGKLTSDIENFVYYGQDLVFTPVLAQA